jgi:hypothetical protein
MPRKRVKPNTTWLISNLSKQQGRNVRLSLRDGQPTVDPLKSVCPPLLKAPLKLSDEHRARLQRCNLPDAALPALEQIAERYVSLANNPPPTAAETCAKLAAIRKAIARLDAELKSTDVYTLYLMSFVYFCAIRPSAQEDPIGTEVRFPNVLRGVASTLKQFGAIVDGADRAARIGAAKVPRSADLAGEVRRAFDSHGVRFSLAKESPAVEVVKVIMDIVAPTGLETARHAVWLAVKKGDKKMSPAQT